MWATAVYVSCALTRGADVMPLVAAVALIGFIFSALQNKCPANAANILVPTICPRRNMEEEATVMSQLKSSGHMKTNETILDPFIVTFLMEVHHLCADDPVISHHLLLRLIPKWRTVGTFNQVLWFTIKGSLHVSGQSAKPFAFTTDEPSLCCSEEQILMT